ncbi:MAG TPA: DMT family transporter [Kofleriaceae bacterium]|nr:DMT family transporter [Kofleriaceae bacterium]
MKAIPLLFILIWSTGFIVAKLIAPVADPDLFLAVRMALAAILFFGVARAARAPWPARGELARHVLAGVLLQAGYLGGTYYAVGQGVAPGIMALLGALQPMLTAALGIVVLREVPTGKTWLGLSLGLGGVALVMVPGLLARGAAAIPLPVLAVAIGAVLSITAGTVLQKTSIARADLRAASAIQNAGAALAVGLVAVLRHETRWVSGVTVWAALAWAAFVLSGLGTFMLVWLIRRGRAANVASLLLLAPPLAATEAYFLFGDKLTAIQIAGFACTLVGVFLCNPAQREPS